MSEHPMETRRRSRSKTPFLRSTCDHENCEHAGEDHVHHHKKRSTGPSVHTILEETIEVSSSSTPTKRAQLNSLQLPRTSDYSSGDNSPELNQRQSAKEMASTNQTSSVSTHTTVITKSTRLGNSAAATSTPKANNQHSSFSSQFIGESRATEEAQNALNAEFERSQQSFGKLTSPFKSFSRLFGNSTAVNAEQSLINGGVSDHLAYLEYKRAGEYWKTTPKTDYTYSELSPHRRELAPGVVAMPNMSRPSLDQHGVRVHHMIERNPSQEHIIRRRYEKNTADHRLLADSGDEVDYLLNKYDKYSYEKQSWLTRIITTIITTVTSVWSSSEAHKYNVNNTWYSTSTDATKQSRGIFGTIGHAISSGFHDFWHYIYAGISSVLYLDTLLLQSSHADNRGKKRFLLLLLLLLPLLLLGAWLLLDEVERLYYLQRSQALVPLTLLASLRNSFQQTSAAIKAQLLELPGLWTASSRYNSADPAVSINLHSLEQNIRQSLTPQEYENILRHVDSYMQQLVNVKLQAQEAKFEQHRQSLTPEQTLIIVQLMRENLERVLREKRSASTIDFEALSEADMQRLVELISLQLESRGWSRSQPVKLTAENLAEIKRLITENIEINNHAHYKLIIEKIDVDALLKRILSAPQLADFIDSRINLVLVDKLAQLKEGSGVSAYEEEQQLRMNELNKEIAFIKLTLTDKLAENAELEQSISQLKVTQDDLLERLQQHVFATDKRFSTLLSEIENKLNLLKDEHFTLLNQQVKLTLVDILGFKQTASGQKLEDIDLQNWVRSTFVAKDYLEERLLELNKEATANMREEIDRSSMLLMRDVSERLKQEILLAVEAKHNETTVLLKGQIRASLSEEDVQQIVKSVLAVYDADKTGLVDFALESAGGQVLSTRCTESYQTKSAQISVFGIPLWYPSNTPRVAISPNVQPGECWAFQGFPGFLVLKLNSMIYVTGFTLEHIPKSLSPTGRIDSAPRNFTVWGLEHEKDQDPVLFGEYEYTDKGASLQYFRVLNKEIKRPFDLVELRIESNHGHPQYTCLYRFRVHGKPPMV